MNGFIKTSLKWGIVNILVVLIVISRMSISIPGFKPLDEILLLNGKFKKIVIVIKGSKIPT